MRQNTNWKVFWNWSSNIHMSSSCIVLYVNIGFSSQVPNYWAENWMICQEPYDTVFIILNQFSWNGAQHMYVITKEKCANWFNRKYMSQCSWQPILVHGGQPIRNLCPICNDSLEPGVVASRQPHPLFYLLPNPRHASKKIQLSLEGQYFSD